VQAVVERAEHAHQCGRLFHAELQMLRRVEDQRRVEDGEAERREDLYEEQRGCSLRSRGEKTFERFDEVDAHHLRSLPRELDRLCRLIPVGSIETRSLPALTRSYPRHFAFHVAHPIRSIHDAFLCRSTRRVMSSRVVATRVCAGRVRLSVWITLETCFNPVNRRRVRLHGERWKMAESRSP
jgi:hypothetical protein